MSHDGTIIAPKRKNLMGRENSLPTYEQVTEQILQEGFIQTLATAPPSQSNLQNQRYNDARTINNVYAFNQTTTQYPTTTQGLPRPAMVHYRAWNIGQPPATDYKNLQQLQKPHSVGFHVIAYIIVIMIVLLLIVFIVKLTQSLVIVN